MNIKTVIFSRDRAMQLDAVLRSFYLHCSDADTADIHVLYLATNDRHKLQYRSLAAAYPDVSFISQKKFREGLSAIMNPFEKDSNEEKMYFLLRSLTSIGPSTKSFLNRAWRRTIGYFGLWLSQTMFSSLADDMYILFLVDDNIFVRDFQLSECVNALAKNQKLLGLSLRLGRNTVFCYPHNHSQSLPEFVNLNDNLIIYDWTQAEYDFGYPLEVSSSLYRLKDVLPFMIGLRFNNPNTLEEQLSSHTNMFLPTRSLLCCYRYSVTFCNPVNKVQTVIQNRAGEQYPYDLEELTDRFDRGERIKVDVYNGFTPNGCHQEVEFVFEKCSN